MSQKKIHLQILSNLKKNEISEYLNKMGHYEFSDSFKPFKLDNYDKIIKFWKKDKFYLAYINQWNSINELVPKHYLSDDELKKSIFIFNYDYIYENFTNKIVSVVVQPSVSRYNGFYTLDGYLNSYDLRYKHLFRRIISKELEINEKLKKNFDEWGSRCQIYTDEIGTDVENNKISKNKKSSININLNTSALYDMGGRYIISSYKINNILENNLLFLNKFKDKDSVWEIFLYKVDK